MELVGTPSLSFSSQTVTPLNRSTLPSGRTVAEWLERVSARSGPGAQTPVDGSYTRVAAPGRPLSGL